MPHVSETLAGEVRAKIMAVLPSWSVYVRRRNRMETADKLPAVYVIATHGVLDDLETDNQQTTAYPFMIFLMIKESAQKATAFPDLIEYRQKAIKAVFHTDYTVNIEFVEYLDRPTESIEELDEHCWWTGFELRLSVVEVTNT